jgi:enoyl-CoA hydratase
VPTETVEAGNLVALPRQRGRRATQELGSLEDTLIVARRGALAEFTLNRPNALNALNDEMRAKIVEALPAFPRDPEVYALIIRSACARAFSAGGDVRELVSLARTDHVAACASFAFEYRMNWMLECFSKPTVSLIDGMTMGSGVGLVLYNTHRVAGPSFSFAMPETAIGLFPDVGAASVLARLPGATGRYLGLTGRRINRATAYRLGLVTHCIAPEEFPAITAALENADPVDPLLDVLHEDPDPADDGLLAMADVMEACFAKPTVPEIIAELTGRAAGEGAEATWCRDVARDLAARCPLSLCVTLRHLDQCRTHDLRETLIQDYRLAVRFLAGPDFAEGVRAMLVDKDNHPTWQHASVDDVPPAAVDEMFASLGDKELDLKTRAEMQAMRI